MNENLEYLKALQNHLKESGASWEAAENQFTHIPREQWKYYRRARKEVEGTEAAVNDAPAEDSAPLPVVTDQGAPADEETTPIREPVAKTDWSDPLKNPQKGCFVTSVLNQGAMGSCEAFAACGLIESMVRIAKNAPTDTLASICLGRYSESYLYALYSAPGDWTNESVMQVCVDEGVIPSYELPYVPLPRQAAIVRPEGKMRATKISKFTDVSNLGSPGSPAENDAQPTQAQTNMMNWLDSHGPLLVDFRVHDSFHQYGKGVYHSTLMPDDVYRLLAKDKETEGHAVLIVGYDAAVSWTDKDKKSKTGAWLVKNSWSTAWGTVKDKPGYFWIGFGECEIEENAFGIEPGDFSQIYEDTLLVTREDASPAPPNNVRLYSYSTLDTDWNVLRDTKGDGSPSNSIALLATHPAIANGAVLGLEENSFSLNVLPSLSGQWSPVNGSNTTTPETNAADAAPKALIVSAKEILDNGPVTVVTSETFRPYVAPGKEGSTQDRKLHCRTRPIEDDGAVAEGEWTAQVIPSMPPYDAMPLKACGAGDYLPIQHNASSWLYVLSQMGNIYRFQNFSWTGTKICISPNGVKPSLKPGHLFAALPDGSILAQDDKGGFFHLPLIQDADWNSLGERLAVVDKDGKQHPQPQLKLQWTQLKRLKSHKTTPSKAKGAVLTARPLLLGANENGLYSCATLQSPWLQVPDTSNPQLGFCSVAVNSDTGEVYALSADDSNLIYRFSSLNRTWEKEEELSDTALIFEEIFFVPQNAPSVFHTGWYGWAQNRANDDGVHLYYFDSNGEAGQKWTEVENINTDKQYFASIIYDPVMNRIVAINENGELFYLEKTKPAGPDDTLSPWTNQNSPVCLAASNDVNTFQIAVLANGAYLVMTVPPVEGGPNRFFKRSDGGWKEVVQPSQMPTEHPLKCFAVMPNALF